MHACRSGILARQTILFTMVMSFVLLTLTRADICQCGSRCAAYEEEHLCARCCTLMVRRSIPRMAYPPEQLDSLQKQEMKHPKLSADERKNEDIDNQLLAQIVEETAQQMSNEQQNNMHFPQQIEPKNEEMPIAKRTAPLYVAFGMPLLQSGTRRTAENQHFGSHRILRSSMARRMEENLIQQEQMRLRRTLFDSTDDTERRS